MRIFLFLVIFVVTVGMTVHRVMRVSNLTHKKEPVETQAAEKSAPAPAPASEPAPEPTPDYWPFAAARMAGTYLAKCAVDADPRNEFEATIRLDSNGKLSAPGMNADVHDISQLSMKRDTRSTPVEIAAAFVTGGRNATKFEFMEIGENKRLSITYTANDMPTRCHTASPKEFSRTPLHKIASRLMEGSPETLNCGIGEPSEFRIKNGILTLGADKFDLRKAPVEIMDFDKEAREVRYFATLSENEMIEIIYGATGSIRELNIKFSPMIIYHCASRT